MSYNLVTILGPTATGKTKLAAKLANQFDGEIISADSRQVYKGMDIGTGKDLKDYIVNNIKVPFHLIDIIEPTEEFNLFEFQKLFFKTFNQIIKRNKLPFLVGGTGLYLSSVLQNYKMSEADFSKDKIAGLENFSLNDLQNKLKELNPELHNTTDLLDKDRVILAIIIAESEHEIYTEKENTNSLVIGISFPRSEIKNRITERLKLRLNNGMIEEVENLLSKGLSHEKLNFFGLEYRYISLYLKNEFNYNDMFQKLNSAIHQFAKRQMTWFRKMEREGVKIHWIEGPDYDKAKVIISDNQFDLSSQRSI